MKRYFGLHQNVFFAGLVSLFMDVSSEMVYPLVPLFLTAVLGATKTVVGVIEGIAESTASLVKPVSGYLSDRAGRRKPLMTAGYSVSALSRLLIAGAGSPVGVLAARFIDRTGKGIRGAPRDAIIAESVAPVELGRAFGIHRAMDTAGAVIGPLVAFVILGLFTESLRMVFLVSLVPAVVAVLMTVFFIRERPPVKDPLPDPGPGANSFDRGFKLYVAAIAVFSLGQVSDAFLILRAGNLGVGSAEIPLAYLFFNMVYALSSAPMGVLADRMGLRNAVGLGFFFAGAVYVGFAIAWTPFHAWGLFFMYGLYKGMSEGAQRAYLARMAPEGRRATAFGAYHMAGGVLLLPASIIGGLLWDRLGPGATFSYAAILSFSALALFMVLHLKKTRPRFTF